MPSFYHRLELINGKSYVLGNSWPISEDELEACEPHKRQEMIQAMKALKIGSIFYRPEMREDVSDNDGLSGAATEHAHYEVWCLHEQLGDRIRELNNLRQQQGTEEQQMQLLQNMGGVRKRLIPLDKVLHADEILTPEDALEQINERTMEQLDDDQVQQGQQGQQQPQQGQQQPQQIAPTNGQSAGA